MPPKEQRLVCVVISLGQGERSLDGLLDASLVRGVRDKVSTIEKHPSYAVRLD
jgi:hypothetical protein